MAISLFVILFEYQDRISLLESKFGGRGKVECSEEAIKWLNKSNDSQKALRETQTKMLNKEHKDIRTKLDNLLELKISPSNTNGNLLSD